MTPPARRCLGVVVPTYRHPVLLTEALGSLGDQETDFDIVTVVVVDGCPLEETADVLAALTAGTLGLHVLWTANGGPSAARNAGIDFLLAGYEALDAIFFLDADNRLQRRALQIAFDALRAAPAGTGWIYGDIDSFGVSWSGHYGVPYSPLLHVAHGNYCDTGSLVARQVFEAGIRFDEDRHSGYEDWDFWLQCLARGFVGVPARFGLSYRQRPESRNKENHRNEAAIRARLLDRHKALCTAGQLAAWEHRDHPRFAFVEPATDAVALFSDPRLRARTVPLADFTEEFWSHVRLPDRHELPPFLVAGDSAALTRLDDAGLLNNAFYLLMRAAARANFAILTIVEGRDGFSAAVGAPTDGEELRRACLWACNSTIAKEIALDDGDAWVRSLATPEPWPRIAAVRIALPGGFAVDEAAPEAAPLHRMLDLFAALRASPYRTRGAIPRWESRPAVMPGRDACYRALCRFLDVEDLACRLRTGALEVGFALPIGAYGGAEKVAYALAGVLRARGVRTHLVMLGRPEQKHVDAFRDAFDTRHFLDVDYPVWGGGLMSGGQEFFAPGDPALQAGTVRGLLAGLDLVVNCNSAPLNAILGSLRPMGVKTATYLHVTDCTALGRPVGHPPLAVAFEHCYDVMLTCSERLREEMHALGVPNDKMMAIRNTAGFTLDAATRERALRHRAEPRGPRPLRLIAVGRLDRQKGVDRLAAILSDLRRRHVPVEVRVVGSSLIDDDRENWAARLAALGAPPEPPVYATGDLVPLYAWADVLLLPSRWEGAPLVIPECQSLGCIPLATAVGAVDELIEHGRDGILVADGEDRRVVADAVDWIEALLANDAWRQELAATALARLRDASWAANFAPFLSWLERAFPGRGLAAGEG